MSKDFTYLKNWISNPCPRPIILECEPSKSGMSLAVYDREEKIFSIGGYGFDRLGCVIAKMLETCWAEELNASDAPLKYGARRDERGKVRLEGACGYSCMIEIGKLIGLDIRVFDSRHGSIVHITNR